MPSEKTSPDGATTPHQDDQQCPANNRGSAPPLTETDNAENDIEVLEGFDETITEE